MVSGSILASGFSRRMQQDKLLMPFEGIPIVEHVIVAATNSRLGECCLVYRDRAIFEVGEKYGLKTVYNHCADAGQSAAVKLAVLNAADSASGYLFLVGDQPFLKANIIDKLIRCHRKKPNAILVPTYDGRRGNPVLFPVSLRDELLALTGDSGGRQIMTFLPNRVVEVAFDDMRSGIDIDTPEMYQQFR